MKAGQEKRGWMPLQKLGVVKKYLDEHISVYTLEKEYGAEHEMICRWVKEYIFGGELGLEPRHRPGNTFSAFHRSKDLSELERFRLLVAKREIEIARLKRMLGGRSWCKRGIHYWARCKYEIIEETKRKYLRKKSAKAGKFWSKEDENLLADLYRAGVPKKDTCKAIQRTGSGVAAWLVHLGIIKSHDIFRDRELVL